MGVAGQKKLLQSRVLVIGAGGLGCPVSVYLSGAGVGTLTMFDDDVVRPADLQRQFLYNDIDILRPKVSAAADILRRQNPVIAISPVQQRFDHTTDPCIIDNHDLVVDCSDNFLTRYLLNTLCVQKAKPLVSGAAVFYAGQIFVYQPAIAPPAAPCYRCLYPKPPEASFAPNCTNSSVLGPLTGVIGTMMAVEVIKMIVGIGETLAGCLFSYDALTARTVKIRVARNPNCRTCAGLATDEFRAAESCISREDMACP